MTLEKRFTAIKPGAITITGNTLGLSKGSGLNPGTQGSIGGFITTNTALPTPAAWVGIENLANNENITLNWQENSSTAYLNIPVGSTVLYAELYWGGSSIAFSADVTPSINNPVTFTTPSGTYSISPDPTTAEEFTFTAQTVDYVRSQDVTSIVKAAGSGAYTVGAVPAAIDGNNPATNGAGWSLIVAYENPSFPIVRMDIYAKGVEMNAATQNIYDTTVSGFATPDTGSVEARILISALEGDCNITGDTILFGPDTSNLTKLYGPNNKSNPPNTVDNFFASQLNIGDPTNPSIGQIDTSGTYGSRNMNLPANSNVYAGRQGYDVTNVDGSAAMVNSQTSATVRLTTNGDGYIVNGLGIQIRTVAPIITIAKSAEPTEIVPGDPITYTLVINNTGTQNAMNFHIVDYMPTGTTLNTSSIQVYGETGPVTDYSNSNTLSIEVGAVNVGQTVVIKYQVLTDKNTPSPVDNSGAGYYCYNPVVGQVFCDESTSNGVTTPILNLGISGTVWYDANCDGIRTAGEVLAEGIKVLLYKSSDLINPIDFTTTDVNGYYNFTNLEKGSYYVKIVLPNGYSYTLSNVLPNELVDSDIDKNSGLSNEINLNINNRFEVVDSGLCRPNTISGVAFYDCNKNGIIDDSDPVLCGVNVALIDGNGNQIGTTTTNCDGYYEFTNIPSGSYTVQVSKPVDMNYVVPVPLNYYGSKPDNVTGLFSVTLTNQDYNQGFAGFRGDFKLQLKYCTSNTCIICSCDDNQEVCKEDNSSCIGCNSCRSNKNISTSRTSCNKCKKGTKTNSTSSSSCSSCNKN